MKVFKGILFSISAISISCNIQLHTHKIKVQTFTFLCLLLDMLLIMLSIFQLFAASFPLAPLMAILLNLIDIRIDAKRMLWSNRRPIAYIRQDIGLSLNLVIISYILNLS